MTRIARALFVSLAFAAGSAHAAGEDSCLKHVGDIAKQRKCYEARVSKDGKDLEARIALGAVLSSMGEYPAALKQFDAVLAISSANVHALNGKALVLVATGKGPEGIKLLEQAMAQAPDDLQTLTNYGRIALNGGEIKIASDAFNRAMSINPNDTEANLGIGELHLAKGNTKDAIKFLAKAVEVDDTNARANYLLGVELLANEPQTALPFLERAAYLAAGDAEAWLAVGRARFRTGQFRIAGQAFVEAGKLVPEDPVPLLEIGKVYVEMNEYADAEEAYLASMDNAKDSPPEVRAEIHFAMGVLQQNKQQYGAAKGQYEKALTLVPTHGLARMNVGVIKSLTGNREEAVEDFRTVLEEYPGLHEARYNLAVTLWDMGERESAQREINALPEGLLKSRAMEHRNAPKGRGVVTPPPGAATPVPRTTGKPTPK